MSILRFAVVLLAGSLLFACEFQGWDRAPSRCQRAGGTMVYCQGNTLVSVSLRCVDDREVGDRRDQPCPAGLVCSMDGPAACVTPRSSTDASSDRFADVDAGSEPAADAKADADADADPEADASDDAAKKIDLDPM